MVPQTRPSSSFSFPNSICLGNYWYVLRSTPGTTPGTLEPGVVPCSLRRGRKGHPRTVSHRSISTVFHFRLIYSVFLLFYFRWCLCVVGVIGRLQTCLFCWRGRGGGAGRRYACTSHVTVVPKDCYLVTNESYFNYQNDDYIFRSHNKASFMWLAFVKRRTRTGRVIKLVLIILIYN